MMQLPILRGLKAHAPCPGCGLHNYLELESCKHCGREFNSADKEEIHEYAEKQKAKGVRFGVFIAAVLLVLLLVVQLNS